MHPTTASTSGTTRVENYPGRMQGANSALKSPGTSDNHRHPDCAHFTFSESKSLRVGAWAFCFLKVHPCDSYIVVNLRL